MPSFESEKQPIYVFEVEGTYLFKHFFDRKDIFSELQEYYNREEYRFEIPSDTLYDVRDFLEDNYFELIVIENLEDFAVVKEKYTEHAEILRNAVMHWSRSDYNFFVMKDPLAVDQAVERGATRITDTDLVLGI